jgi:hypothetical protein
MIARATAGAIAINKVVPKYDHIFSLWLRQKWLDDLALIHREVQTAIDALGIECLEQPNPFDVSRSSKKYVLLVLERFALRGCDATSCLGYERCIDPSCRADTRDDDPFWIVLRQCKAVVGKLGSEGVELIVGPLKKIERVFEKAELRGSHESQIYDYARLSLVVSDLDLIPKLVKGIFEAPDFRIVRAKNRLSPTHDSKSSGGYRDYQVLVQVPTKWIVEVQIIPQAIYELKKEQGHEMYRDTRLVLEVFKRQRSEAQLRAYDLATPTPALTAATICRVDTTSASPAASCSRSTLGNLGSSGVNLQCSSEGIHNGGNIALFNGAATSTEAKHDAPPSGFTDEYVEVSSSKDDGIALEGDPRLYASPYEMPFVANVTNVVSTAGTRDLSTGGYDNIPDSGTRV